MASSGNGGRDGAAGSGPPGRSSKGNTSTTGTTVVGGGGGSGYGNSATSVSIDYVRDGALAAHKKMSGALLNKLGFARTSPEPPSAGKPGATSPSAVGDSPNASAAAATAASKVAMMAAPRRNLPVINAGPPATTRSRKGSLRKNILQRGSLQRMETILSPRAVSQMSASTDSSGSIISPTSPDPGDFEEDYPTPRIVYNWDARGVEIHHEPKIEESQGTLHLDPSLASGTLSRSSTLRDNSTTDEDERPPGSSSSNASSELILGAKRPTIITDSYFPQQPGNNGLRRRSPNRTTKITKSSPLSAMPLDAASTAPLSPEAWDYGETEWWGWIILFVTWITFVVGMGSCFGAWSWAWDVGETPYAPPELEDDPTLPIVGYYPALIVLTGVMAWVWVITAWVGMKYFKHAKMSSEDG